MAEPLPPDWPRALRPTLPGDSGAEALGRVVAALALTGALVPGLGAWLASTPWWDFVTHKAASYGSLRPWVSLVGLIGIGAYATLLLSGARWFFRCGFTTATWATGVLLWAALAVGRVCDWPWLGFLACVPGVGITWAATVLALEAGQRGGEGRGTWGEAPSAVCGGLLGGLVLHTLFHGPAAAWTGSGLGWLTGGYLATRSLGGRA